MSHQKINIFSISVYVCFASPIVSVLALYFLPSYTNNYKESIFFINAVNRAQLLYFNETQFFDKTLHLKKIIDQENEYYKSSIIVEDNLAFVYTIAQNEYPSKKLFGIDIMVNKEQPLYSSVGAVYMSVLNNDTEDLDFKVNVAICVNKYPGKIQPPKPILEGDRWICGAETEKL